MGTLATHREEDDDGSTATDTPEVIYARPTVFVRSKTDLNQQSLAQIGRPIPQVSHVPDPVSFVLTLSQLEPKVISLCHQYRASSVCTSV